MRHINTRRRERDEVAISAEERLAKDIQQAIGKFGDAVMAYSEEFYCDTAASVLEDMAGQLRNREQELLKGSE